MARVTKSRLIIGSIIIGIVVIVGGWMALRGGPVTIDPGRIVSVERGDLAKSVVATGRIEPIAKVEITRSAKVRRAKLYYLRDLKGKAARMKDTSRS